MDKYEKIVADFKSSKFEEWKPYLTKLEQAVFVMHEFKCYTMVAIADEISYSERQVYRILKSARKKINKLLP